MATVYLSLGSNIRPERHVCAAIHALRDVFGELVVSPVYRTRAVGFPGADFLNAASCLHTDMSPQRLNDWLHALEDRQGRRRDVSRFSSRTLDIDILLYDGLVLEDDDYLQLPRAELATRAFVLKPMVDIAPNLVHPTLHRTLAELWQAMPEPGPALRRVALSA